MSEDHLDCKEIPIELPDKEIQILTTSYLLGNRTEKIEKPNLSLSARLYCNERQIDFLLNHLDRDKSYPVLTTANIAYDVFSFFYLQLGRLMGITVGRATTSPLELGTIESEVDINGKKIACIQNERIIDPNNSFRIMSRSEYFSLRGLYNLLGSK
jgi:hypothetical protein